jgi:hypothetical protein
MTEQRREAKASEYIEFVKTGDSAGGLKYLEECFGADDAHTPEDDEAMKLFSDEVLPMVQDMINETVENATVAPAGMAAGNTTAPAEAKVAVATEEVATEEAVDATDSAETSAS